MITLIGLPLGIWLVNRSPATPMEQPPWPVRGLWFLIVGWWASFFAKAIACLLIVLLVTLPLGLLLFQRKCPPWPRCTDY